MTKLITPYNFKDNLGDSLVVIIVFFRLMMASVLLRCIQVFENQKAHP